MSNTYFLRFGSICSFVIGTILVLGGSMTAIEASLTGPGTTVLNRPEVTEKAVASLLLPAHGAPLPAPTPLLAQAEVQLFLGIIFIMVGFLLYILARVHRETRRVRVRVRSAKDRKAAYEAMNMKRKGPAYFWMEIRI